MNYHSILNPSFVNFVSSSRLLNKTEINHLYKICDKSNDENKLIFEYENKFSSIVGLNNSAVCFGSARMAFFSLMYLLGIKKDDEIIIQSATCSVMVNAIIKIGATPVFADMDLNTLGTSADSVIKLVNQKTKLIVAQHSFGIPCEIDKIVECGKKNNIFVLEDCALTLTTFYKKKQVGNWGDAAIFSTDHTKPINTLIGGILYSKNKKLITNIKSYRDTLPNFSASHQLLMLKQYLFENKYFRYGHYYKGNILLKISNFFNKILFKEYVFLNDDTQLSIKNNNYPYPAKMPPFIAQIGLYELQKWDDNRRNRHEFLQKYINVFKKTDNLKLLPKSYLDDNFIVPNRLVFFSENIKEAYGFFKKYFPVEESWFRDQIIGCDNPEDFGYVYGSCKNSEKNSKEIINFPVNNNLNFQNNFTNSLKIFFKLHK